MAETELALTALAELPGIAAEYVDPQTQLGNMMIVPLLGLADAEETYRELSRSAALILQENRANEIAIRVAPGASAEARVFEKMLRQELRGKKVRVWLGYQKTRGNVSLAAFRADNQASSEAAPSLSHESLMINLVVPGRRRYVQEWRVDIIAPNAAIIKSFHGANTLPTMLTWDWRNTTGELATAGQYRCRLNMVSHVGKKYAAIAEVEITLTRREVTLRLTQNPKVLAPQNARTEASAN